MRSPAVSLTALLLVLALAPALPPAAAGSFCEDASIPVSTPGVVIDAYVCMPDPVAFQEPDGEWPAIIVIHGYGGSKDKDEALAAADRGYVGFAYSTRGFGKSTGQMDVVGPGSIQDLKDLVQVLGARPGVDAANIGVTGCSYGGGHSLLIATHPDAGVKTTVPCVPWSDLGLALRPNGVLKLSYTAGFYATGNGLVQSGDAPAPLVVEKQSVDFGQYHEYGEGHWLNTSKQVLSRRQAYDTYDPAVHVGFASLVGGVGEGAVEQYLRERSAALRVDNIHIPIFIVQGLSDDLFPGDQALPFFQLIPSPAKKLYLGYVGHPRANADENSAEALHVRGLIEQWFDFHLKGIGTAPVDPAQPIVLADTPWDGTTRTLGAWPGGSSGQPWVLHGDGSLLPVGEPPAGPPVLAIENTYAAGMGDDPVLTYARPNDVGAVERAAPQGTPLDTLVFRTAALPEAQVLLGTPRAELTVTSTGLHHQVAVKVYDRDPDTGATALVTRGIYGVRDNLPGLEQRVTFDLQAYHYVFPAGHQVEVRVTSSDFPTYMPERAPFTTLLELGGPSVLRMHLAPVTP